MHKLITFDNNYDKDLSIDEKKVILNLDNLISENKIKLNDVIDYLNEDNTNEGLLGGLLGGLAGFALGQSVGKIIAHCLGVDKGILYDILTSRLLSTALGYELGKR